MYYEVGKTAKIIKNLRKESGKTQEMIAEGTGINIKTYQAAEQGRRGVSIDTLCIIASYFQVSLDYLITGAKANNEWGRLTEALSEEQKAQLYSIAANMVSTLGWK